MRDTFDANQPGATTSIWRRCRPQWLRSETALLLIGLGCTLGAKFLVVRELSPLDVFIPFLQISLPDVIFFVAVATGFRLLASLPWRNASSRLMLVIALGLVMWSLMNAAWLIRTGVQLQPEVLTVLAKSTDDFWPMAQARLAKFYVLSIALAGATTLMLAWFVWRMIRPIPIAAQKRLMNRQTAASLIALVGFIGLHQLTLQAGTVAFSGRVFGFSSHWHAVAQLFSKSDEPDIQTTNRLLPRAGERQVVLPSTATTSPPNIVIFLLESVSFAETSLADPQRDLTPVLARLAREGAEFRKTYVPLPQTTKAFWSTLTGSTPEIYHGFAEALLADRTYESLATILKPMGYRSGFFQMSTGTFECLPALFSNLGFDSVWFSEDLHDNSAQLSALTGDDFRLIEPVIGWIEQGTQPFLLTLITSASHDPFIVPEWFETPADDRIDRMRQSIRFTDSVLGQFLKELDERGLSDNTIVCVMGDHGESCRAESKRGRFGLFEEIVRVPWVMRWPGHIDAGLLVNEACSQLDVTPTLLQLIGADISRAEFDGCDALGSLPYNRKIMFGSWTPNAPLGFVHGRQKIVYWPTADVMLEYDLTIDPNEQNPAAVNEPRRQVFLDELREWQRTSQLYVEPRRFREAVLYDRWRVFASGRFGRSMYLDPSDNR